MTRHIKRAHPQQQQQQGGAAKRPRLSAATATASTSSNINPAVAAARKKSALNGAVQVQEWAFGRRDRDPRVVLEGLQGEVVAAIKPQTKWYVTLQVRFRRDTPDGANFCSPAFRNKALITLGAETAGEQYEEASTAILKHIEAFELKGSGWVVENVEKAELHSVRYRPLAASSYLPTPPALDNAKKGLVNVQNQDQKCFQWSVLAALYPAPQNAQRVDQYQDYVRELDWSTLLVPTPLYQMATFERHNGISVNVFGYEDGEILPLRVTAMTDAARHVNLLLLTDDTHNHYITIRNISNLFHHITRTGWQHFICPYCLQHQNSNAAHQQHLDDCRKHGAQKVEMPAEGATLQFDAWQKQLPAPVVVYADFEAILVPQADGTVEHQVSCFLHIYY